jgi:hypothetical protein
MRGIRATAVTATNLTSRGSGMRERRVPKVGDKVAIPGHAVIFIVKSVDESEETVTADAIADLKRVEEGIAWKRLTFIDSK